MPNFRCSFWFWFCLWFSCLRFITNPKDRNRQKIAEQFASDKRLVFYWNPSLNLRSVLPGQKDLLSFMTWSRLFSTSSKFTSSVESVVLDEERESCVWSPKKKTRSKTRHLVDIYSERKGKFQKQKKKQNRISCWHFLKVKLVFSVPKRKQEVKHNILLTFTLKDRESFKNKKETKRNI